jgi:AraC-like DNA-binding protein
LSAGEGAPLSARLTLTRVKFWIETHLAEKLSGEEIARHCDLSLRHLNRLFESEDTSLMQYVWKRRLARVGMHRERVKAHSGRYRREAESCSRQQDCSR